MCPVVVDFKIISIIVLLFQGIKYIVHLGNTDQYVSLQHVL